MNRDEFYRVPFTSGETLAVLALLQAAERLTAGVDGIDSDIEPGILRSAIARFQDETPDFLRDRAQQLAAAIEHSFRESLHSGGDSEWEDGKYNREDPPFPVGRTLRLAEEAFRRRLPVEIEYFVRSRNEWTARVVDISDIREDESGSPLMMGHCSLRGDIRQFRLDHIREIHILDDDDSVSDPFEEE